MKQEENAIPAHRASLASSHDFFFFFNKSENAKEILCKVELQSIKIQAGSGPAPAPVQELGSEIRRSQAPTTEWPCTQTPSQASLVQTSATGHGHGHISEDFTPMSLECLQYLAP